MSEKGRSIKNRSRAMGLLLGLLMHVPSIDLQAQHHIDFEDGLASLYFNGNQFDGAGFLTFTNEKNFSFPIARHKIGTVEFYQVEGMYSVPRGAIEFEAGGFLGDDQFNFDIANTNVLILRKNAGIGHLLELSNGAHCTQGGVWTNNCSADVKHLHKEIQGTSILQKIKNLPLYEWSNNSVPNESHIGPTAEDFRDLFGVGTDRKTLASIDLGGVNLAGLKSLYNLVLEQAEKIRALEEKLNGQNASELKDR